MRQPTYDSQAGQLLLGAARIRAEAEAWKDHRPVGGDIRRADRIEERVRETVPQRLASLGAGQEIIPNGVEGRPAAEYRSTVAKPDYVAAAASRERLDLAQRANALELALDAADTVGTQNSIEAMLSHQLAVAHASALKLTEQMNRQIERMSVLQDDRRQAANVEATRLAGAVSRLMLAFQNGAITMRRMRSGGHQVVTVQHVNVAPGGKAVVAGNLASVPTLTVGAHLG